MGIEKLGEFVKFVPGINSSRVQKKFENQEIEFYDQASFENDYSQLSFISEELSNSHNSINLTLNEGDVVISNSLQKATIVSKDNIGKVLSLNFTKVEFEKRLMDKGYFLFLFNSFKDVKRQKEKELQGTGSILRIPVRLLSEITVPVVSIDEQKKIGAIYLERLKLQNNLNKYSKLIEQFTNSILEDTLRGE